MEHWQSWWRICSAEIQRPAGRPQVSVEADAPPEEVTRVGEARSMEVL